MQALLPRRKVAHRSGRSRLRGFERCPPRRRSGDGCMYQTGVISACLPNKPTPISKHSLMFLIFVHDVENQRPPLPGCVGHTCAFPCVILRVQHLCCVRHSRGYLTVRVYVCVPEGENLVLWQVYYSGTANSAVMLRNAFPAAFI
jgi:hypothetical protein